jgi:predicted transcriptional regulator
MVFSGTTEGYPMETNPTRPVSLKLESGDHDRLKTLAEARQRSAHFLMKEAIHQYLDREEARQAFKDEALDSWRAFKETGRHLSGQELDDWLATWGTPHERKIPPCHE